MRISTWTLTLLTLASAAGCSTIDKSDCKSANWSSIGAVDGEHGRGIEFFDRHMYSCGEAAVVSREDYMRGREEGLVKYCTRDGGYMAGKSGEADVEICSEDRRAEFEEGYRLGRKIRLIDEERQQYQEEIEKERERFSGDRSFLADVRRVIHAFGGASPTSGLEAHSNSLAREKIELESRAPIGSLSARSMSRPIDNAINVGGIAVGFVTGFGLGHAVQGRYASSGWKWTLGETALIGAMIASSAGSCESKQKTSVGEAHSDCSSAVPLVAALSWLGVKVWQTMDLYQYTYQQSLGYPKVSDTVSGRPVGRSMVDSSFGSLDLVVLGDRPSIRWTKAW